MWRQDAGTSVSVTQCRAFISDIYVSSSQPPPPPAAAATTTAETVQPTPIDKDMGLLKHFLLPIFSLFHAVVAKICLIDEGLVQMSSRGLSSLKKRDLNDQPPTELELHFTRTIGGMSLVFVVNNIIAIFHENGSHYRGIAILLEAIYFTITSYSCIKGKRNDSTHSFIMLGVSVIGLIIHSMEPGIFTKDKSSM